MSLSPGLRVYFRNYLLQREQGAVNIADHICSCHDGVKLII